MNKVMVKNVFFHIILHGTVVCIFSHTNLSVICMWYMIGPFLLHPSFFTIRKTVNQKKEVR